MTFVGALLTIGSFLAFFIGLVRPSTFSRKGKPTPSRLKVCLCSIILFLAGVWFVGAGTTSRISASKTANADTAKLLPSGTSAAASDAVAPAAQAAFATSQSDWTYSDQVDQLTSKHIRLASVVAPEQLDFRFPYNGGATAILQVRKHPRYGNDVILSIDKGQFVCGAEACWVMVRFDNGNAIRYTANVPTDYSSTTLFISPSAKFIAAAKKAKRVVIEASFYQDGNRAIVFPIEHLDWQ